MRLPMKNLNSGSKPIDTVVFDFDGTLADTIESSLLAFESTLLQFHFEPPKSLTKEIYGALSTEGMFRSVGISDFNLQSKILLRYNELYREIAPRIASLFAGVRFTLNLLMERGFRLAIATNEHRENLDILLRTFCIDQIFHTTCCADEVSRPKPWPDMGRKVVSRLDADPTRCLMLGDSVVDIEMARSNHMRSCVVSWGATSLDCLLDASPNFAITNFQQLLDILGIVNTNPEFQRILPNKSADISEASLTTSSFL